MRNSRPVPHRFRAGPRPPATAPGAALRLGFCLALLSPQTATAQAMTAQAPGTAQPAACPAGPLALEALPAALRSWGGERDRIVAATRAAGVAKALLTPGKPASVALASTPAVRYPIAPGKPGGSVSHGGILAFDVPAGATYRVAQDGAAWIDVIEDGKALASIAHGRAPECSGIHKMVDFALKPGRHLLQVSAAGTAEVTLLVAPL